MSSSPSQTLPASPAVKSESLAPNINTDVVQFQELVVCTLRNIERTGIGATTATRNLYLGHQLLLKTAIFEEASTNAGNSEHVEALLEAKGELIEQLEEVHDGCAARLEELKNQMATLFAKLSLPSELPSDSITLGIEELQEKAVLVDAQTVELEKKDENPVTHRESHGIPQPVNGLHEHQIQEVGALKEEQDALASQLANLQYPSTTRIAQLEADQLAQAASHASFTRKLEDDFQARIKALEEDRATQATHIAQLEQGIQQRDLETIARVCENGVLKKQKEELEQEAKEAKQKLWVLRDTLRLISM